MVKVAIAYFSGVGNTKKIAHLMHSQLKECKGVEPYIYSIENLPEELEFEKYDKLIFGGPTYHSDMARPLNDFIKNLNGLKRKVPAFLFTTCGIYSTNTLKNFSELCIGKNIIPVLCKGYRCAATDGILLTPYINAWYSDEKNIEKKINMALLFFVECKTLKPIIPHFKVYSILNYPNKYLGQHLRFKIYTHEDKCIKCLKCIKNCPTKAFCVTEEGYPKSRQNICINCYRCIHHCPQLALSIFKRKTPSKTLFY